MNHRRIACLTAVCVALYAVENAEALGSRAREARDQTEVQQAYLDFPGGVARAGTYAFIAGGVTLFDLSTSANGEALGAAVSISGGVASEIRSVAALQQTNRYYKLKLGLKEPAVPSGSRLPRRRDQDSGCADAHL